MMSICQILGKRLLLGGLCIWVAACGSKDGSLKWTEDVLLADGRIVTLTRYHEFHGPHAIGEPPAESEYWLEFKHPDTGQHIRWENDGHLKTVALMLTDGVPELLVYPVGSLFMRKCPDPPYLLFRFEANRWAEVPLSAARGRKIKLNMTVAATDVRNEAKASDHRLSVQQVLKNARNPLNKFKGHDIDLGKLRTQSFGSRCDPPFDWMLNESGEIK
jgi:hypothetical protein